MAKLFCKSCGMKLTETGFMANMQKQFGGTQQPIQYFEFEDGYYCKDCSQYKELMKNQLLL